MATKISAVMTVTDTSGKVMSKSITDIKPDANPNAVVDFLQALNNLSTNSLGAIELVTRTDILSDYDETDPQFTVTPSDWRTISTISMGGEFTFEFEYKGSQRTVTASGKKPQYSSLTFDQENKTLTIKGGSSDIYQDGDTPAQMILTLPAGDGYKEATVTITMYDGNKFQDI